MKKIMFIILLASTICSAQTMNVGTVGEFYGKNGQGKFIYDLNNFKKEFSIRHEQRQQQLNLIPLSWNNKFQCTESTAWEGGTCSDSKVIAEVNSFHLTNLYLKMVLSANICGGGGSAIPLGGECFHNDSSALIALHEFYHGAFFGAVHEGSFMNSSCNKGYCAYNTTISRAQDSIVNSVLDKIAGKLIDTIPLTLNIMTPFNNQTYTAGSQVFLWATTATDVRWVDIVYDGVLLAQQPVWDRNTYFNKTQGIRYYIYPPKGTHTFTVIVTDVTYHTLSKTVSITVTQ